MWIKVWALMLFLICTLAACVAAAPAPAAPTREPVPSAAQERGEMDANLIPIARGIKTTVYRLEDGGTNCYILWDNFGGPATDISCVHVGDTEIGR